MSKKNRRYEGNIKRKLRKLACKRDILVEYLIDCKIRLNNPSDFEEVFRTAKTLLNADTLKDRYTSYAGFHAAYDSLIMRSRLRSPVPAGFLNIPPKANQLPANNSSVPPSMNVKVKRFYRSLEWRKLRYEIIKQHGSRCLACGRDASRGAVIHVDHIKPLRKNWHLRLDPTNLQPLCELCNHGKGNWDQTDFREKNANT